MGKGEIARNKQFLLFRQCFLLNQIIVSPFVDIFDIISLFTAVLEKPKLANQVKGSLIDEGQVILASTDCEDQDQSTKNVQSLH